MGGILFDDMVFGPIRSRRLGVSLGINLLPTDNKYCNFNCIYCECGWTSLAGKKIVLPGREELRHRLEEKLKALQHGDDEPNALTFAGNGEPTTHPEFSEIINDTLLLRDQYAPRAKVSVLSNASMLHKSNVREALKRVDLNIQKLDAGTEEMYERINQPLGNLTLDKIMQNLLLMKDNLSIQTLFLRGHHQGSIIDNTTEQELEAWLQKLDILRPVRVMLYSIDRETPAHELQKVTLDELNVIAGKVRQLGLHPEVYG